MKWDDACDPDKEQVFLALLRSAKECRERSEGNPTPMGAIYARLADVYEAAMEHLRLKVEASE